MVQWINLNQINRSVVAHQYPALLEEVAHPPTTSGSYGCQAVRESMDGF